MMNTGGISTVRDEAGFGLIEVLAAVLVLAIGVIGFAGLQMRAVQASGDSYYRTQAMSIAQDLAERVRVNSPQIALYKTAAKWPVTAVGSPPNACRSTATCTAAQMADFDIADVRYNAETLLPQGLMLMETCKGSAVNCIYVSWDGLQPLLAGVNQCVDAVTGVYKAPSPGQPAITCVMLEVQ